jgi:predicted molibdopterin-dependent oxidoreductase YjgC
MLADIPITHNDQRFGWQELPVLPSVNGDGRLLLVTQDHLFVPGVTGRYSSNLRRLVEEPVAELHPAQLDRIGVRDGEKVGIQANGADLTVTAKANDRLAEDVVYLPVGFPDAPVGALLGAEATVAVSVRAAVASSTKSAQP